MEARKLREERDQHSEIRDQEAGWWRPFEAQGEHAAIGEQPSMRGRPHRPLRAPEFAEGWVTRHSG